MNTNKIATGSMNKKLLAALAVLAVAIVALAAIPAVASDSDSDAATIPSVPSTTATWDEDFATQSGVYTYTAATASAAATLVVSKDVAITVSKQIASSLTISAGEGVDSVNVYLILPAEGTTDGTDNALMSGSSNTLTVGEGVNLVVDDQRAYPTVASGRTIDSAALTINGSVWFIASGDATIGSYIGAITMNGGYLDISQAHAVEATAFSMVKSQIVGNASGELSIIDSPSVLNINCAGTIDKDSKITLTGASRLSISGNSSDRSLTISGGSVSAPTYMSSVSIVVKDSGSAHGTFSGTVATYNSSADYESTFTAIDLSITSSDETGLTATMASTSAANVTLSGNGTINSATVMSGASFAGFTDSGGYHAAGTSTYAGVLNLGDNVSLASGATITVQDGAQLSGTVNYTTGTGSSAVANSVKLDNVKAGADGIKVSAGTGLTFTGNTQKGASDGTITVKGAVSLTGTTVIGDGVTLDVSAGKLTVPTGATLVLADTANVTAPAGASSTVGITSTGTVALDKTTNSLASTNLVNAGVPATAQKTAHSIKAAAASDDNLNYKDGDSSSTTIYTATLTIDSDAIADKASAAVTATIKLDASAPEGYKVEKVWYTVTTSSGTQTVTVKDKDAPVSDDGKYVLNLSSVQGDVFVYATITGAYSAAFYVNGELYDSYTDVKPNTTITFPSYTASGYSWDKWYSDVAMTKASDLKEVKIVAAETTTDGEHFGSVAYYGKAIASYAVRTDAADGSEITVEPVVAYQDQKVTVKVDIAADSTDKYRVSGLSITDASGNAVAYTPAFSADVTEYTFTMPASAVTVKSETVALYSVEAYTSIEHGYIAFYATESAAKKAGTLTASATGYTAAADDVVYIKVTPETENTTYALKALSYVTGDARITSTTKFTSIDITSDDIKVVAGDIYKITMPAAKLTLKAEFEQAYSISVTSSSVSIGSTSVTPNVKADQKNAVEKALVTITAPSVNGAKLTGLTVTYNTDQKYTLDSGITKVSDTKYTFEMPKFDVTITYVYSVAYTITDVSQTGAGNMIGPSSGYKAVAEEKLTYTDQSADGISLRTITVTYTSSADQGSNPYKVVYNAITGTAVQYVSADATTSTEFAAGTMWKVDSTGDVYTFIMPAYDCSIAFDYGNTVYYTVTPVGNVELYYDEDLTEKVPDLTKVEYGTYYIKVVRTDNQDVSEASASYTHAVTTGTGTSAVTTPAGTFIPVSLIGELTAGQAEYSVLISVDTTITAVYKAHMTTVTIQTPTNGTLAVMNGTAAVQSGTTVPAGTTLTIVPTANDKYAVDNVYVNGEPVTTDGYTFELGLENVTVSATFVPGYSITVTNPTGVSIDAPKTGYENQTVKVTYTEDGYTLQTLSVATSSGAVAATKVSGESAYTFVMPAGDVTITGTSQATGEQPVAAMSVYVSVAPGTDGYVVIINGIGGYVPAGKVSVFAFYPAGNSVLPVNFDLEFTVDTSKNTVIIPLESSVAHASDAIYGQVTYTSDNGSIPATQSAYVALEVGTPAQAVAATTEE